MADISSAESSYSYFNRAFRRYIHIRHLVRPKSAAIHPEGRSAGEAWQAHGSHIMKAAAFAKLRQRSQGGLQFSRSISKDVQRRGRRYSVGYETHHISGPSSKASMLGNLFPRHLLLTRLPLWKLMVLFLIANWLCVCMFAGLYYAAGEACFVLPTGHFSFGQMLWLSIHAFTTVGFGSVSPAGECAGPQLCVFLEHFVGLIDIALFTAVGLAKLLQPNPQVRFSRHFLIAEEGVSKKALTFRMVRKSSYELRDCEISVQCGLVVRRHDGIVIGCNEEPLALETSNKSNLETWFVSHIIDEKSPLQRLQDLAYMNVTLKVFDTAFQQEVRLYHNYTPGTDMMTNAAFEIMKFWRVQEARYTPEQLNPSQTTPTTGEASSSAKDPRDTKPRAWESGEVTPGPRGQHASNMNGSCSAGAEGSTSSVVLPSIIHKIEHIVDDSKLDAFRRLRV